MYSVIIQWYTKIHVKKLLLTVLRSGLHGGQHRHLTARGFQVQLPAGSFCVESACSPCVCVGSLRYSGFLPPSKNMHVRLTGDSKLSLGVSVSVCGCVSLCGPVMDWRPVQGFCADYDNDVMHIKERERKQTIQI